MPGTDNYSETFCRCYLKGELIKSFYLMQIYQLIKDIFIACDISLVASEMLFIKHACDMDSILCPQIV